MDTTTSPSLEDLFAQLGLPNAPHEMRGFITRHRPLDNTLRLADAPFWNAGQAELIRQKLAADDQWSLVIDTLNTQLREHPDPDAPPRAQPPQC